MLETERLIIRPLTGGQLVKYMLADNSLETELAMNPAARTVSPELQEALEQTIMPNTADPSKNYLYNTLWTIISKKHRCLAGDLCFVGEPNGNGEIEIGYGTYEQFRGQGFMTEAVGAMIAWATAQMPVRTIVASTDKDNAASSSILIKNNFVKSGETDTQYQWRLALIEDS